MINFANCLDPDQAQHNGQIVCKCHKQVTLAKPQEILIWLCIFLIFDHLYGPIFVSPMKHGRPRCHTFGFRSLTLEGMHHFHSNFTEGSSIIKYRSSLKRGGGYPQNFDSYGPFLTHILAKMWFPINNF